MIVKTIPASWIEAEEHRLDCGPFTSGRIEARKLLEAVPTEPLIRLTNGGLSGIYHVGMDKLRWVVGADHGMPFLRSSDILKADLSNQRFISKAQVEGNPLFRCPVGSTLITRSGSIGRMSYCRADMAEMPMSQDVLKVVPDGYSIPSGYLFAFLSSKFGIPLVVGGTFGSIIVHIEAENIAELPVPRLDSGIECETHKLIEKAARQRDEASRCRAAAICSVTEALGWKTMSLSSCVNTTSAANLGRRMDAFHHSTPVDVARGCLAQSKNARLLGEVVESVFEPNRGSRLKVDDPVYGVPFLSSSEVFRLDPSGDYLISRKKTPHLASLLVSDKDLFLPRSGQLGGIIGRAVLPLPTYYGDAASEHLVRIRCRSQDDAFYLWSVFATQPGYYAAIGTAFGSSIPSLDCGLLAGLRIPWLEGDVRRHLVSKVRKSVELQTSAIEAEKRAVAIVEAAIEEAA